MKKYIQASGQGLIRTYKPDEQVTYLFRSPILLTTDEGGSSWFEPFYDPYTEYSDDIEGAIGDTDLAEYLPDNLIDGVNSITMTAVNSLTNRNTMDLMTTVVANKHLTDVEIEDIIDYLSGQFSDGWGEGLEQNPIFSYEYEYEEEYVDEETGEEDIYLETVTASVYCHVWYRRPSGIQREPWSITLERVK